MKITERIALLKAGYTKDEIAAMLEEDKKQVKDDETKDDKEKNNDTYADVLISLANEVKNLKETMQASNRDGVDTLASNKVDEAKKILEGLINPIKDDKKED